MTFAEGELSAWPSSFGLDADLEIGMFFNYLRLEDQPVAVIRPKDERERRLFGDAIAALRSDVAIAERTLPLWHLAAFWRALYAIYLGRTVSDLGTVIDRWRERFVSALAAWYVDYDQRLPDGPSEPEGRTPEMLLERMLYWGYHADLRHGRVLEYVRRHGLPRTLEAEAIGAAAKLDHLALPTVFQPWGGGHQRYQELLACCEGVPA